MGSGKITNIGIWQSQTTFFIKSLKENSNKRNVKKYIANITLNGRNAKSSTNQEWDKGVHSLLFRRWLHAFTRSMSQEKEIKGIQIRK